jgi:2-isopropylmalate synthase
MAKKLKIFDTTLRDGEQSPGAAMTVEQKVKMATALDRLGVNRIEAGFPVSSPVQFDGVKRIGETVKHATVVALARCRKEDIDAAIQSLAQAKHPMLHLFIATSPLHREFKLKLTKQEILDHIANMLDYAAQHFDQIEFSAEDASRTETDYLIQSIKTAIEHGATTINIPDTVGYAVPSEFGQLIHTISTALPQFKEAQIDLSVHCHNDLGLAVANSIAAVQNGATQVEVTLNGIGERAGNCSLEELVMALRVRNELFGFRTSIKTDQLFPTSKLLQNITGLVIARNKPIFGENVFSHESGIHQHGMLNHPDTYEIMKPHHIGRSAETLIMGRHSGQHSLKNKLKEYGIKLTKEQFEMAFRKFTHVADVKKEVYDEDIFSIVASILGKFTEGYQLDYFHIYSGNTLIPTATVKIRQNGRDLITAETGDGPVDALFRAIDAVVGLEISLREYLVHAIGSGKDAQGQVKLIVEINEGKYVGKGSSTDIIEASALAYLNAINRFLFRNNKALSQNQN